jgi:hypothetical protein
VGEYLDHLGWVIQDERLDLLLNRVVPRPGHPVRWAEQLQACCWMDELVDQGSSRVEAAKAVVPRPGSGAFGARADLGVDQRLDGPEFAVGLVATLARMNVAIAELLALVAPLAGRGCGGTGGRFAGGRLSRRGRSALWRGRMTSLAGRGARSEGDEQRGVWMAALRCSAVSAPKHSFRTRR